MSSNYSITVLQFQKLQGVKLKVVIYRDQVDVLAGAYAVQRYLIGRKPNSIKSDQESILNLYRFCERNDIDLHRRIRELSPITIGEIEAFSIYCSFRRDREGRVGVGLFQSRMRGAKTFIGYLWKFYQGRISEKSGSIVAARARGEAMESAFEFYLKAPYQPNRTDKVGLTPEMQARFYAIINPSEYNELNPWVRPEIRWRNYILLMAMMLGGNRKGETLLLKLNHLQLTGRRKYFEIEKPKGVVIYARSEVPSVKTFGRQVDLHDDLAAMFEYYITKMRVLFAGYQRSSYVFLSARDGQELSLLTPNAILNSLIAKNPEFKGVLTPHLLRNTFHDLLNNALESRYKDSSPLSKTLLKSPIQEAAGGWSQGSTMPQHYSKGSINSRVSELQREIQQRILGR